jgi:hypothetical protein
MEQLRWVSGGLLGSQNLPSLWPYRVVLIRPGQKPDVPPFVFQNGQYVMVVPTGTPISLSAVGAALLRDNTPHLPDEAENGLIELFSTLHAEGSKVTWGGPVPTPDLAWARMQLFATNFDYSAGFHIFVTSLRNGSTILVAEKNAFGKQPQVLETEAEGNLRKGNWTPVSVGGRALDPRRDFGEHTVDEAEVGCYLADAEVVSKPDQAEVAFKAGVEAGGAAMALGYEGLADLARFKGQDGTRFLEDAIRAGSTSASVYLAVAQNKPGEEGLPSLKRAQELNGRWAEPVFQEGEQTADPKEKEELYKRATQLDPRGTQYWLALAELQMTNGHASASQGSWLRAEDSAPTETERERIHQLRLSKEDERLDAMEAERRQEREAVHIADQKAQDAEADRIRAAEQKANESIAQAGGQWQSTDVVPWNETLKRKELRGTLTDVNCAHGLTKLSIRDRNGRTLVLLLEHAPETGLSCGPQPTGRAVLLSFAAEEDRTLGTAGRVLSFQFQ